ncbi:MAG: glycosyltransferase [Pseudomonadota bacterium]
MDVSAESTALGEQIALVLEQARALLGVRVVRSLPDGWGNVLKGDTHLFRGLGRSVDLLHHCHPAILGRGTDTEQARTWCYTYPTSLEPASVAPGSTARACFVGTVHYASMARAVWWAEAGRLGLPIDFAITLPWKTEHLDRPPLSDIEYSDRLSGHRLAVNFTQRLDGTRILTARTIEVLLAGGMLLEESSADSAYFFQPGVHYLPFESLADLRGLIERLLGQPERCRALADAGQRWASRYCSGDIFWAELLTRLDRL